MTIDDAIKHCEEEARENRDVYSLCPYPCTGTGDCKCLKYGKDKGCVKLATEYRQLAEWLQELKDLKENHEED